MPTIASCASGVKSSIGFRFRALPSEVMASRSLSSTAKLLFAAIADAARGNRSGLCKVANATLADRIGRSESEVGRCLLELEAAGLVSRRFGQSKNVRIGVAVTWSESVPQDCGTERPSASQVRAPGSPSMGDLAPQGSGPGRTGVENPNQTNALALDSGEEKIELDRKPSPSEIAAALRAMTAGRYAPQMFDGTTTAAPPRSTGDPRLDATPARADRPPTTAPGKPQPPDVATMARRVGFSAFVAAGLQKRDDGKPPWKAREGSTYQTLKEAQGARRPRNGRAPQCS